MGSESPKESSTRSRPAAGNRIFYDDEIAGFGVRITRQDSCLFVLNYMLAGESVAIRSADIPNSMPRLRARRLSASRRFEAAAIRWRERASSRAAPTVDDLFNDYMERHAKIYLRPNTIRSNEGMARKDIFPKIGRSKSPT